MARGAASRGTLPRLPGASTSRHDVSPRPRREQRGSSFGRCLRLVPTGWPAAVHSLASGVYRFSQLAPAGAAHFTTRGFVLQSRWRPSWLPATTPAGRELQAALRTHGPPAGKPEIEALHRTLGRISEADCIDDASVSRPLSR